MIVKRVVILLAFLLTACSGKVESRQIPSPTSLPPTPTAFPPTSTGTPEPSPTATPILQTSTPAVLIPVTHHQGPGEVVCPILLYHNIDLSQTKNQYYTTPDDFRSQMYALREWGYTPIPISLLLRAINFGADLPVRPVVITFDDGDATVFTNAFPVMQELGFKGVVYIVAGRLHSDGYMDADQIKELIRAGWEVGSHSMTHIDLTTIPDPTWQIVQSKAILEQALGIKIRTFAYPLGLPYPTGAQWDAQTVVQITREYYSAAVGLGASYTQSGNNIYYLWRRPVLYGWDVKTFGSFLPWDTPPTPVP